jgi:hypothetical protein
MIVGDDQARRIDAGNMAVHLAGAARGTVASQNLCGSDVHLVLLF